MIIWTLVRDHFYAVECFTAWPRKMRLCDPMCDRCVVGGGRAVADVEDRYDTFVCLVDVLGSAEKTVARLRQLDVPELYLTQMVRRLEREDAEVADWCG